jgi:arylsulfotransferase ASST/carbohydrate binding protein with CBM4/9 domain
MKRLLILLVMSLLVLPGLNQVRAQNAPHELGYLYLSPVPGASYVSPQTRYVLVRFEDIKPSEVTNLTTSFITVTGATSGPHSGVTHVASDGRTVIFEMRADFSTNELVTVTLNPLVAPGAGGSVGPYQYQFMIAAPMPGSLPLAVLSPKTKASPPAGDASAKQKVSLRTSVAPPKAGAVKRVALMPNGVSVPSDFPQVVITANTNPSPGYLFLENALDGVPAAYTMMLDNNGLPIWYRRGRMFDFKVQKNGTITWGLYDATGVSFSASDQNFNYLKTYVTTNGYLTDVHELKVLADGSYFMIGDQYSIVDLSRYIIEGGTLPVMESVVQEFTAAGELIFQWRAWDNYDIRDVPLGYTADFPHMNAIDIDEDGNILVSARHLSEVTKINHDTGEIIWRLSGAHSSFSFPNDPFNGTSFQHSISALGNGHYMVFDNGNDRIPEVSRAVEYQLDLANLTATMAWQFRDTPDKYTYYTGNAQRLPTGNTLIDFALAQYPKAIEVDTNGVKRFELSLVPESDSYRAFRFPWHGVVAAPYLIAEPEVDNITLIFNKFGDTNVQYYRIYGGTSPNPTTLIAESGTTIGRLSNLQNGLYYFRVTAVNTNGVESPFSNEESINVNFVKAGQNMIQNGNFSQGTNSWTFNTSGSAGAAWAIENGASHFYITNGGTTLASIQLVQPGMSLIQGNQYVLEFDAWSSQSRYIDVELVQGGYPFNQYSAISSPFLTPNHSHYRYVVTMRQPSDLSANLLFNLGASTADVYLDNISLFNPPVGDLNLDGRVNFLDLGIFGSSWLKQQTGLPADLDGNGKVDFNDFGILGGNWATGGP